MNEEKVQHPGVVLKAMLKERGLTHIQLADAIQGDRSHLSHIIAGRRPIHVALAAKLSAALGTTPEFWLDLQQKHDLNLYRRKNSVDIGSVKPLARRAEHRQGRMAS